MRQPFFLAKLYAQINQTKLLCFQKNKQTSIKKNFTGNRDHINKKQGWACLITVNADMVVAF